MSNSGDYCDAGGGPGIGQNMTFLPEDFKPGDDDVICGRGKKCYNHVGNERFRKRVEGMLDEYSKAKSKLDKSGVLASVVDMIRAASPSGGFVKQDEKGRWYEVGDFLAREKTSQAFRDALHERYKSSNVAKKKRRQEEQAKASDKFHRIARSFSDGIGSRLEWLSLTNEFAAAQQGAGPEMHMRGDPRYGIIRGAADDMEAVTRLSSLAEMRARLNRRFGAAGHGGSNIQVPGRPGSAMDYSSGGYNSSNNGGGGGYGGSRGGHDPLFGDPGMMQSMNGEQQRLASFQMGRDTSSHNVNMFGRNMRERYSTSSTGMMSSHKSAPTSPQAEPRPTMSISSSMYAYGNNSTGAIGSGCEPELDPLTFARRPASARYEQDEMEMMHHSMPNLGSNGEWGEMFATAGSRSQFPASSMHNSAPDLMFNPEDDMNESMNGLRFDLEPIPLTEITPRPQHAKKSIGSFANYQKSKPISLTLSPTSPSAEVVSRDLMKCLEKLTGSSIKDNNPFDPLPLGEEDDEDGADEDEDDTGATSDTDPALEGSGNRMRTNSSDNRSHNSNNNNPAQRRRTFSYDNGKQKQQHQHPKRSGSGGLVQYRNGTSSLPFDD